MGIGLKPMGSGFLSLAPALRPGLMKASARPGFSQNDSDCLHTNPLVVYSSAVRPLISIVRMSPILTLGRQVLCLLPYSARLQDVSRSPFPERSLKPPSRAFITLRQLTPSMHKVPLSEKLIEKNVSLWLLPGNNNAAKVHTDGMHQTVHFITGKHINTYHLFTTTHVQVLVINIS